MKKTAGFTLIEMLVAISIFTIVTTFATMSFANYMSRINVNDHTEKLKMLLEESKGQSIVKGIEGFNVNYELYGVKVTTDSFQLVRYNDNNSITDPENICLNIDTEDITTIQEIPVENVSILDKNLDPFPESIVIFNKRGFRCGTAATLTINIADKSNSKTISLNNIGGIDVN